MAFILACLPHRLNVDSTTPYNTANTKIIGIHDLDHPWMKKIYISAKKNMYQHLREITWIQLSLIKAVFLQVEITTLS